MLQHIYKTSNSRYHCTKGYKRRFCLRQAPFYNFPSPIHSCALKLPTRQGFFYKWAHLFAFRQKHPSEKKNNRKTNMKEMFLNSQATTDRFLRQGIFIICLFANANRSSVYLTMALPRSHYIFTVPYLFFHLISSLTLEPNRLFIYFFFISDDDLLLFFFSYFLSGCLFHVLPFTFWPNPVYLW